MNRKDLKKIVDEITGEIELIADERVQSIQKTLLNLIELLMVENGEPPVSMYSGYFPHLIS